LIAITSQWCQEPVEDRRGEDLVAEDLAPFAEGLVRGQDDRTPLVSLGDHLEDQVRLGAFEGLVAHLVDHENARPQIGAEFVDQPSGRLGSLQVADHVVEAGEVDRVAGPAGRDGQGDGDMRLSDPGRSQQRGVRLAVDEREAGEVFDLARVEFGLEGEVVLVQRLVVRQLRQSQALAEAAVVADGELFGQDQVKEVEVAHLRLVGATGVLVDGLRQVGQAELAGRGADAVAGQLAQDDSFVGELVVKGRVPVSSS
jgi:hypothetical protein